MRFLVTGMAGFIGSHFGDLCLAEGHNIFGLDKMTYAGNESNLPKESGCLIGDICEEKLVRELLGWYKPDAIFNFAAESHVDRSIVDADTFIHSNVRGTYVLLREALAYWNSQGKPESFRFVQISTDEVFGDLGPTDAPFTELSPIRPNSPYAASKASADCLVSAFSHTYGLPTIITRCSNNYGPRQYPEKLIPLAISKFLRGEDFIIHGDGSNVRDWISVEDHCLGILASYLRGNVGETYCFGGNAERSNKEVVVAIRDILGRGAWTCGPDRPGNDRRYAIDFSKAVSRLDWHPRDDFESGLRRTVTWYQENAEWLNSLRT